MTVRGALLAAVVLCTVVQLASASFWVRQFDSPNTATAIARNLSARGRYEGGSPRIWRPYSEPSDRFQWFQLPGEPLYLAGVWRLLPEPLHRYAHVPVTALLVASVASVASLIGGARLALATGLVGSLQPFVVLHGPVWDDTFLSAALVWFSVGVVVADIQGSAPRWQLLALPLAAGWAAITRLEPQMIFASLAVIACLPSGRRLRLPAGLAALGVLLALGAWGLRNRAVVGQFQIGSSHDGITLWESNGPYARQAVLRGQVEVLTWDPAIMLPYWQRTRSMTETEADRFFTREALGYVTTHPGQVLLNSVLKFGLSLVGIDPSQPLVSPRNLAAAASAVALLALGLRGLFLLSPDPLFWRLAGVLALAVTAMLLAGPIGLRYRITADGLLWIGAAAALLHYLPRTPKAA